jgi:acetyl-CoA acyltransferase 1
MSSQSPNPTVRSLLERRPNDVVITTAFRTAMTRGKKGGFKDTSGDSLLYSTLKAVNELSGVDPGLIEDISVGALVLLAVKLKS